MIGYLVMGKEAEKGRMKKDKIRSLPNLTSKMTQQRQKQCSDPRHILLLNRTTTNKPHSVRNLCSETFREKKTFLKKKKNPT